ncbi:MAG: hypothetical protein Q8R40_01230, partial [bacterium]|nr:hypothetical protein [bacterium]
KTEKFSLHFLISRAPTPNFLKVEKISLFWISASQKCGVAYAVWFGFGGAEMRRQSYENY